MRRGSGSGRPALSQAWSCQKRAAKTGFDWESPEDVRRKLDEELEEFRQAETPAELEEELGDILFCVVSLARLHKTDPETALRMAVLKFRERFGHVERTAAGQGKNLFEMSAEEKIRIWNEIKNLKPNRPQ